ncbi:hypothetical protein V1509DRAFT_631272 [Lipomyces kononenkoae]
MYISWVPRRSMPKTSIRILLLAAIPSDELFTTVGALAQCRMRLKRSEIKNDSNKTKTTATPTYTEKLSIPQL